MKLFGMANSEDANALLAYAFLNMKKKIQYMHRQNIMVGLDTSNAQSVEKGFGCFLMIKLENVVLASPEQMAFVIQGMRNPMNSWEKSDSEYETAGYDIIGFNLGKNDLSLMRKLSNAGTDHRKFMRMMPVYVRITAPLYWWKEFDTYKVGTVANSCSTMHKIQEKEFTLEDFSTEHLLTGWDGKDANGEPIVIPGPLEDFEIIINMLNQVRNAYLEIDPNETMPYRREHRKQLWYNLIQLLPSSYNQTRNVMMNYEVLANIYSSRKDHKLDEWREFCQWIEELPYSELITTMIPEQWIL